MSDHQHPEDDDLEFEAPERGSADELLDAHAHGDHDDPLDPMRHSAAHVMAEAVLDLFPGTKLGIGPAIKDGFYYDFDLSRPLTPEDLPAIEARMRESVAADHPFVRKEWDPDEGRAFLAQQGQSYKVEILDDLRTAAELSGGAAPVVTTYQHGPFIDLCRGPHVASTGKLGPFKLLSVAGAYWRGREDRPMLQRIYGTVWNTQEELDLYLWRRDEARKRDHRRLGVELDLFSFHDVSPGSAFWHPKGQRLWRTLEGAMRELQDRRGYQEVSTPILVSERLWEQSGHWDHYADNMFRVESEDQLFSLKPMNCPESTFIYRSHVRSYRDLPLRFAEYGRLHRNERSGDALGADPGAPVHPGRRPHLRPSRPADGRARGAPGRDPRGLLLVRPRRRASPSRRDRTRPSATPRLWERAEAIIKDVLDRHGGDYAIKPKDGTFYAPKIDIYIDDALGREWQMATIQVDLMMLPERFDLSYIDENGQPQRPMAIHRAIYGSLERFIGILVEHFGGRLPVLVRPGPGGGRAHRGSPQRGRRRAGERAPGARPAGRGRRLVEPDAEQDPASHRSRRCPTCSCSATGRSRRAPSRPAAGPGSSSPPLGWEDAGRPTRRRGRRTTTRTEAR